MFGKRLREVRMRRHLTQQKLADSVGLALRSYQCYEQGTREPPLDMLKKLSDVLDVSVDYLMERTDVPTVSIACAIPKEFHTEIFEALIEFGISKKQIVYESNQAAFVGEGFIIEGLSPKEMNHVSSLILKTMNERCHLPAKSADESR